MDAILTAVTNFQTLIAIAGILALFIAIIAPISIRGHKISLEKTWQRISLAVIGFVAILGAITISLHERKGELPIGSVLAWLPVGELNVPPDWVVCGQNGNTPSLAGYFLMGVASVREAGKRDGSEKIPADGGHTLPGNTEKSSRTLERKLPCNEGQCGLDQVHHHEFKVSIPTHDHGGENRPPFYTVIFLCKVK